MTQTLDLMPTEVVREIAVNLEVDGCLALARTCHSLRADTLDALILKQVIGSQHTLWNFHSINLLRIAKRLHYDNRILQRYKFYALDQDRLGRWDKWAFNRIVQNSFGLSLDVWTRYAVADQKAFRLCSDLNTQVDGKGHGKFGFLSDRAFNQTMQYLPHILVLKHPSIHASGLAPALAVKVVETIQTKPHAHVADRLAFSYCATMLSQDTPEAPLFGASSPRAAMNAFFKSRCTAFAARLKAASEVSPSRDLRVRRQPARMSQSEAQIIIGAFSSLLRHAFREYRVRRLIGSDYYTFILPFALDVPMDHGFRDRPPPVPFADDSLESQERKWEDWHTDQIYDMTSCDFLTKGEWVGCYSYTYANVPEIDAPMMDIAFEFTSGGQDEAGTAVHATGIDSLGAFRLDGEVERSGHVCLNKVYEDGMTWEWNCQMTPFGIGGIWGPPNSDVVNGSVWLWKKGWTDGRVVTK